ncbi:class I SAM-dependent methyltransferase [Thaumasiovibrio subtropicus]|uniref:class I SAM-dependent methyltransferase n=1 Tax=Thaumasiovibrio subtropicus TaxID=1891207 RepID=UPI000B35210D|nr:class I SAM-dependent methyltransferase [Thaumasiovibrio subtropicus]
MAFAHAGTPMAVEHAKGLNRRWRHWLQNPFDLFAPYIKPGMKVMDFGCGGGFALQALHRLTGEFGEVWAVDCQQGMLNIAQQTYNAANIEFSLYEEGKGIGCEVYQESVDFAVAFYVIHEVGDVTQVMKDITAALRPGGQLLLIEFWFDRRIPEYLEAATQLGMQVQDGPKVFLSKSFLLCKAAEGDAE